MQEVLDDAQGAAVYVPEKEALIWKIKSFPGGREFLLRCKFGLPSVAAEEEAHGRMPPMRVSFETPPFPLSSTPASQNRALLCGSALPRADQSQVLPCHPVSTVNWGDQMQRGCMPQVRYLKVIEKSGYQALPWVRYITTGGEYEVRARPSTQPVHHVKASVAC